MPLCNLQLAALSYWWVNCKFCSSFGSLVKHDLQHCFNSGGILNYEKKGAPYNFCCLHQPSWNIPKFHLRSWCCTSSNEAPVFSLPATSWAYFVHSSYLPQLSTSKPTHRTACFWHVTVKYFPLQKKSRDSRLFTILLFSQRNMLTISRMNATLIPSVFVPFHQRSGANDPGKTQFEVRKYWTSGWIVHAYHALRILLTQINIIFLVSSPNPEITMASSVTSLLSESDVEQRVNFTLQLVASSSNFFLFF